MCVQLALEIHVCLISGIWIMCLAMDFMFHRFSSLCFFFTNLQICDLGWVCVIVFIRGLDDGRNPNEASQKKWKKSIRWQFINCSQTHPTADQKRKPLHLWGGGGGGLSLGVADGRWPLAARLGNCAFLCVAVIPNDEILRIRSMRRSACIWYNCRSYLQSLM